MSNKIKIFDTTLRDGEQAPGFSMNLGEKLELARQIELLGVDIIEAGFAIVSNEDFESVRAISENIKRATVASLARLTQKDIDQAFEAVRLANNPRIHTFIATSDIHMKHKLKMSPKEVLERIDEYVGYAKTRCFDIEFSAEDATRSDPEFLRLAYERAIAAGATVINVPDTVGYTTPGEMYTLIDFLRKNVKGVDKVDISVHCHDDLGLAVANSLSAIKAGATQAECTVNGIGERAGNAALEEIVMALATRRDFYAADCGIDTKKIYRTSKLLSTITGSVIPPNKSIVGANAFAHEAGIHQHGVLSERTTYEIMTPKSIGIPENKMVLGKHSGKHALEERLSELGYALSAQEIEKVFADFKVLADRKKSISDKDLEAMIGIDQMVTSSSMSLESFSVHSGSGITATASVAVVFNGERVADSSIGDGPIDAAFKAVERIAGTDAELVNYTINSVTEGEDALGEVSVKLKSSSGAIVTGRGLSTDIIEASIKAYINGVNKILT